MAEKITESILEQLIQESLAVPQRSKSTGKTPPPLVDTDVYTVDQYSIDREEKKEWIEIR